MTVTNPNVRAYFITFTTYGSRLRGDPRGSTDRRSTGYGEPFITGAPRLAAAQNESMKWPAFVMADRERRIVAGAITSICASGLGCSAH